MYASLNFRKRVECCHGMDDTKRRRSPHGRSMTGRTASGWRFYIGMNIEVFGFLSGFGPDPIMPSGPQTHRNYAWRDYGNRVGIWNLFDLFRRVRAACLVHRQQLALR